MTVEMILELERRGLLSCILDKAQNQNHTRLFETRKPNRTRQNSTNWKKKTRAEYQETSKQWMLVSKKLKYFRKILLMNWIKESLEPRRQKYQIHIQQNQQSMKTKPR